MGVAVVVVGEKSSAGSQQQSPVTPSLHSPGSVPAGQEPVVSLTRRGEGVGRVVWLMVLVGLRLGD